MIVEIIVVCITKLQPMKKHYFVIALVASQIINATLYNPAIGQNSDSNFYVVIGAFANPRNAQEFTEIAKKEIPGATNALNPHRKLYYVFVTETPDKNVALAQALVLQKGQNYSDTWVYTGLLGENPRVVKNEKENTVVEKTELKDEAVAEVVANPIVEQPEIKQPVEPVVAADGSKPFIFKIRSIDTSQEIVGDVDIFDADIIKGRKVVSYRGNDVVKVKPINKSGNIAVVCDVFGYQKVQLPVNFLEPNIEDAVSVQDGNIVVSFDLVRLKKGDKVIMYNVYYFNHAAIMRPESRFEVNALLEMLKERPTSRIKIHGHTNGNSSGKLITLGDSQDYFSLSLKNHEERASAATLSEERAKIMQSYLISQGIDKSRMEIKAWGGKNAIYDKNHALAQANVRVEIEILEE